MQFPIGRLEALIPVPSGGAAVSGGNVGGTATATVPEDEYFLSDDGALPGLCATLEQQLNDSVQGYPTTGALLTAALGYGNWSSGAGYLFNEASGNAAAAYGSPASLTATSSPTYGTPGPRGGIDKAVGFDSASDAFLGGTGDYDVGATDDLLIGGVLYFDSIAGSQDVCDKGYQAGGGLPGWLVHRTAGNFRLFVSDGVDATSATVGVAAGTWYAFIAALDRASNLVRIGVCPLGGSPSVSSSVSTSAVGSLSNAVAFTVGNTGISFDGSLKLSALYVAKGNGIAGTLVTNLSTALANFAAAVNAAWSVTPSATDGRVSIGYSTPPAGVPSFSLDFTNTTLRDLLGFERNIDYPTTPEQVAEDLGMGDFSTGAGYLCNEASGNLAAAFGAPAALTVGNTPTYGTAGPRGGTDAAIGFDSTNDQFDGGDAFDVGASHDLMLVWVGRWTALPTAASRTMISRAAGSFTSGWALCTTSATNMAFQVRPSGGSFVTAAITSLMVGEWHVGIAVLDRGASALRIGIQSLSTGTQALSSASSLAGVGSIAAATNFRFGLSAWALAELNLQLAAVYVAHGANAATGVSNNLSTALGNFAAQFSNVTGTQQARGVWHPGCPIFVADSDPRLAPVGSDARTSVSPTGRSHTLVGNYFRIHRMVSWSHVPIAQIREQSALYPNASWRTFWDDTQLHRGSISWFKPGSPVLIVDERGGVVGQDMQDGGPTRGWSIVNPGAIQPRRTDPGGNDAHWRIELPEIIAEDE